MMKKCEIFKNFYGRFPVWQHVTITHISNPDATLSMKTTIHPCSNLQPDLEHPLVHQIIDVAKFKKILSLSFRKLST